MKPITLLLLTVLTSICHGQIRYADTRNESYVVNIPNGSDFKTYESQSGYTYKLGDVLTINRPSTNSNNFTTLFEGKVTVGSAILGPPRPLSDRNQAERVIITRIYVYHMKLSKKSLLTVCMFVQNPDVSGIVKNRTIQDFEKAYILGEIINPKEPMSRESAIAKLKESKDLLDLGIISQSRYDSMKAELTPTILNK